MRRPIILALVPLLLLPGLAHAHASPSSHDPDGLVRAPHIHLRMLLPWFLVQAPQQPSENETAVDHDSDAVYLPAGIFSAWHPSPSADVPMDSSSAPTSDTLAAAGIAVSVPVHSVTVALPRPPIYLLASSLLI
jgi:hypothetical protein